SNRGYRFCIVELFALDGTFCLSMVLVLTHVNILKSNVVEISVDQRKRMSATLESG
ncbi:unnamed protein product, partial [Prunus brigantina]